MLKKIEASWENVDFSGNKVVNALLALADFLQLPKSLAFGY
jgi:hypothetical protein